MDGSILLKRVNELAQCFQLKSDRCRGTVDSQRKQFVGQIRAHVSSIAKGPSVLCGRELHTYIHTRTCRPAAINVLIKLLNQFKGFSFLPGGS